MKREAINHPKVRLLARDLGISILEARGLLVTLWTVVALNYPRGDIGRLPNDELAVAIDWPHDPNQLVDALVARRLLDRVSDEQGRLLVHDWHEHADDMTQWKVARARTTFANGAESKRKLRDEVRDDSPTPPDRNGQASDGVGRRQTESVSDGLPSSSSSSSSSSSNPDYSNARQQKPPDTGEIDTHTRSAEACVRRSVPHRELPGFPAFWAAYPRKVARAAARKAWGALAPDEVTQAAIQRALTWQRTTADWTRDGGRYVPYPATWLRAERWLDEHHTTTEDSDDQMLWGWECTNAVCPDGRFHRTTRADKPADYRCPHLPRLALVGGTT